MKIITWNVNGIRSVFKAGFKDWLANENPDILCLQEIKISSGELTQEFTEIDGYHSYFNSASRRGYAGVAIYSKIKPLEVEKELKIPRFDSEGRCLKLTFENFSLFNFYIPNGARDKSDMEYKLDVYKELFSLLKKYSKRETLLCGDFNIAHNELDLYYPKQNENNTMFTPEERKQIDLLEKIGYIDSFRKIYPEKKAYTWWPYAFGARERDIGWRIDYIFISQKLENSLESAFTQRETPGSDHGPYGITLDIKMDFGEPPTYPKKKTQEALFGQN
ncbi:exodeoxyribonuclease III [Candidatus Giovannonibacteria bacterium]|nr:exodeoxyribonuclease III [Candidatus Giovannonibacteria bacterium]